MKAFTCFALLFLLISVVAGQSCTVGSVNVADPTDKTYKDLAHVLATVLYNAGTTTERVELASSNGAASIVLTQAVGTTTNYFMALPVYGKTVGNLNCQVIFSKPSSGSGQPNLLWSTCQPTSSCSA